MSKINHKVVESKINNKVVESKINHKVVESKINHKVVGEAVTWYPGDLPFVLSVPHGGSKMSFLNVPLGKRPSKAELKSRNDDFLKKQVYEWVTQQDSYTIPLAHQIRDHFFELTGKRPHMVVANFSRKAIDVNRPYQVATIDNPLNQTIFLYYHELIQRILKQLSKQHPNVWLFDIHGHRRNRGRYSVYVGTCRKLTLGDYGLDQLKEKLLDDMQKTLQIVFTGDAKFESTDQDQLDPMVTYPTDKYLGGYTVQAHYEPGIRTVQLEFGKLLRSPKNQCSERTAIALAQSLAMFFKLH